MAILSRQAEREQYASDYDYAQLVAKACHDFATGNQHFLTEIYDPHPPTMLAEQAQFNAHFASCYIPCILKLRLQISGDITDTWCEFLRHGTPYMGVRYTHRSPYLP